MRIVSVGPLAMPVFSSNTGNSSFSSIPIWLVQEVRLAAGAEFVVMICGDIMTMPGLPKVPASSRIDIDDDGKISGFF